MKTTVYTVKSALSRVLVRVTDREEAFQKLSILPSAAYLYGGRRCIAVKHGDGEIEELPQRGPTPRVVRPETLVETLPPVFAKSVEAKSPQAIPSLAEVFAEFSAALDVPLVIAGGAVRDSLIGRRPKDWDVFTFNRCDREALDAYDQASVQPEGYASFRVRNLVWRGEAIQVIDPKAGTPQQLLALFDWNVTQFYYDGKETFCGMDPAEIRPGGVLRLVSCRTPQQSLRRGLAFAARYEMTIAQTSMTLLHEALGDASRRDVVRHRRAA